MVRSLKNPKKAKTNNKAEKSSSNSIGIFKLSNISGKRRDLVPDDENSDMDSESSDSDEEEEEEAVLQLRKVSHEGCVNRIRAMAQNPNIVASWADTGHVQVWDFSKHLNALAESESHGASAVSNQSPLVKFDGHKDEGYAIDWSPLKPGRLLSGDCKNCIYLWEPTSGTWNIDASPFIGHTASVEDLQWSPIDPFRFASCSVDGTIALWDTRERNSPSSTIKTHKADVNVISWNKLASNMLASGSDDGSFCVHDIRFVKVVDLTLPSIDTDLRLAGEIDHLPPPEVENLSSYCPNSAYSSYFYLLFSICWPKSLVIQYCDQDFGEFLLRQLLKEKEKRWRFIECTWKEYLMNAEIEYKKRTRNDWMTLDRKMLAADSRIFDEINTMCLKQTQRKEKNKYSCISRWIPSWIAHC